MVSFSYRIIIAYFLFGNTCCYLKLRVIILAFFLFIGIMLIFSNNNNNLSAHNFYQNNDSVLFTLIKQFEIEKHLAAVDLYTNKSVGSMHSERADVLLGQLSSTNSNIAKNSNLVNKYNSIFPKLISIT
jgi:4-amino-4-deoxy-L-arabinose transferase-like glycosyltransferase